MDKEKNCLFAQEGEKGITETSAQHLCALATQLKAESEKVLENVCFVNTEINIIGSNSSDMTSKIGMGQEELETIKQHVTTIAELNSLISWFSEARSALEGYKFLRRGISFSEWCEMNNIELLKLESFDQKKYSKRSCFDDMVTALPIKEKQLFYALQATASVYGKFIHKDSPMSIARNDMHKKISEPYATEGEGRDTIIKHYTTSVEADIVDQLFLSLQSEYRIVEQQLNHMKADLRDKLQAKLREEENAERLAIKEYSEYSDKVSSQHKQLMVDYNQWRSEEEVRLSKIKFAIPVALEPLIAKLNNLGN